MSVLDQIEPKNVFRFFEALCAIPHGSGNTKAVSDWLVSFAAERGLEHFQDGSNNVIIIGQASPGYETAEPVILQGHMDMVCEKDPDCGLDMAKDGLQLAVDEEEGTVFARGTTLGGDDGIAVAMMLALLDDPTIPRPRIECVFTVDEEIGMLGAAALDVTPLHGTRMINLDFEDEGIFTASCAGGRCVTCLLPVRREDFSGAALAIEVRGLMGGHSGMEINKGRANACMLLGRVLWALRSAAPTRIISVAGGLKDNAIPVRAVAEVITADASAAARVCRACEEMFRSEYAVTDPKISVAVEPGEIAQAMDETSSANTVCLLQCLPFGVQAMSADIPNLVETSLNLGILTTSPDQLSATFSVRSSVESRKEMLTERLRCLLERLGGSIELSGDYPAWAFRRESPLRSLMTEVFVSQYGHEPVIDAIHAGVECGLFCGKIPGLDCVSIGPDMTDIHTPREKLHIASSARTWKLLLEILQRMK